MKFRNLFLKGLMVLILMTMTACSTAVSAQVALPVQAPRNFNRPTATTTATQTLAPTATELPTATVVVITVPTETPSATPNPVPCNQAAFAGNVTLPDLTSVIPGRTYTKTWQLRNIGTCTWNNNYSLVFISGDQLSSTTSLRLPGEVRPGSYVNVSVPLTMPNPAKTTTYTNYWMLKSDTGQFFGIGTNGNAAFWASVTIFVH